MFPSIFLSILLAALCTSLLNRSSLCDAKSLFCTWDMMCCLFVQCTHRRTAYISRVNKAAIYMVYAVHCIYCDKLDSAALSLCKRETVLICMFSNGV